MIKMKLKVAIAAMLTVTMMPTAVPVKAQTVNAAIKSTKQYAEKKHNVQENKTYAEGEAIILYQKNA